MISRDQRVAACGEVGARRVFGRSASHSRATDDEIAPGQGFLARVIAKRRRMTARLAVILVAQVEFHREAAEFQVIVADAAAGEERLALRKQLARAFDVRRVQRLDAETPGTAISLRDFERERRRLVQQHLRIGAAFELAERVSHQRHQLCLEAPRPELAREREATVAGAPRAFVVGAEERNHRLRCRA